MTQKEDYVETEKNLLVTENPLEKQDSSEFLTNYRFSVARDHLKQELTENYQSTPAYF